VCDGVEEKKEKPRKVGKKKKKKKKKKKSCVEFLYLSWNYLRRLCRFPAEEHFVIVVQIS
jgi:hypothetical protein